MFESGFVSILEGAVMHSLYSTVMVNDLSLLIDFPPSRKGLNSTWPDWIWCGLLDRSLVTVCHARRKGSSGKTSDPLFRSWKEPTSNCATQPDSLYLHMGLGRH